MQPLEYYIYMLARILRETSTISKRIALVGNVRGQQLIETWKKNIEAEIETSTLSQVQVDNWTIAELLKNDIRRHLNII